MEEEKKTKAQDFKKGKEVLTVFHNFKILPNLSRWFRTQNMKK